MAENDKGNKGNQENINKPGQENKPGGGRKRRNRRRGRRRFFRQDKDKKLFKHGQQPVRESKEGGSPVQQGESKREERPPKLPQPKGKGRKVVFLDRDGTIIEDKNYLSDPEHVILFPNTIDALQLLIKSGYGLVITTNQSGLARKFFTKERLEEIHSKLKWLLSLNRIHLLDICFCPHHPKENCSCRKPKTGMAVKAGRKFNIDLKNSFSMGDRISDVEFGRNFGGRGVLVLTGAGMEEKSRINKGEVKVKPDYIAKDIYDAAKWIARNPSGK